MVVCETSVKRTVTLLFLVKETPEEFIISLYYLYIILLFQKNTYICYKLSTQIITNDVNCVNVKKLKN